MKRAASLILIAALAASTPALAEKTAPASKVLPFLDRYLKVPAAERARVKLSYALKRDGKPLYEYARAGIELERPPRQITIYRIELLSLNGTEAEIDVACSKGTYIRTLAQDIGRVLGCYAHLTALRRTHVGPFSLERAVALDALQAMPDPKQALLALNELPEGLLPSTLTLKDSL